MRNTQHIWGMYLMALGALRAHSLYSLSQTANHIKHHPRHVAYALQKLFKEGLECMQEMDIIIPLGVDEMVGVVS